MNNKKTGPIFSLVPRDRRSTYLVICTSTRRTFVRILLTSIYVIRTLVTSFLSSTGSSTATTRQGLGVRAYSSLAGGDSSAEICAAL